MADRFTMTLDSAALEAKLKSLSEEVRDKILAKANKKGAEVFQEKVIEKAPERVDDVPGGTALPPGALKSDVVITKAHSPGGFVVEFGDLTAHVAEWVDQGHRLVRGGYSTEIKNKKGEGTGKYRGKGKEVGSVAPHPFFREAFEEAKTEATDVIAESIVQDVDRAWKKTSK